MKKTANDPSGLSPIVVQNFATDDLDDVFRNLFATAVATQSLRYVRTAQWRSEKAYESALSPDYLRKDDQVLVDIRDECDLRLALRRGGNLIQLFACTKFGTVAVGAAGADPESAEARIEEHRALFESPVSEAEGSRPRATFGSWYMGEKGPEREEKALGVPAWHEISENYSARTSEARRGLLGRFQPGDGLSAALQASGGLLLWHGKPGTGKTFAIRALAWKWREWCKFEYILDPENLFGARAGRLCHVARPTAAAAAAPRPSPLSAASPPVTASCPDCTGTLARPLHGGRLVCRESRHCAPVGRASCRAASTCRAGVTEEAPREGMTGWRRQASSPRRWQANRFA